MPDAAADAPTDNAGPAVIETRGLTVRYGRWPLPGRVQALSSVDLTVRRGEIVGLLGPNGSGKSTLLGVLAGDIAPTAGSAMLLGRAPGDPVLAARVGYQPEGPLPFPHLDVRGHLLYLGALAGLDAEAARDRAERLIDRFALRHAGSRAVRTFSTGMRRRTALAGALLVDPEVLLLDEPTAGLDPEGSAIVLEELAARAAAGTATLLASHHLLEIERSCERVCLLVGGVVHAEGTLDELLSTGDEAGEDAEFSLAVHGLDEGARQRLADEARGLGATTAEWSRPRTKHLFSLFREVRSRQP